MYQENRSVDDLKSQMAIMQHRLPPAPKEVKGGRPDEWRNVSPIRGGIAKILWPMPVEILPEIALSGLVGYRKGEGSPDGLRKTPATAIARPERRVLPPGLGCGAGGKECIRRPLDADKATEQLTKGNFLTRLWAAGNGTRADGRPHLHGVTCRLAANGFPRQGNPPAFARGDFFRLENH